MTDPSNTASKQPDGFHEQHLGLQSRDDADAPSALSSVPGKDSPTHIFDTNGGVNASVDVEHKSQQSRETHNSNETQESLVADDTAISERYLTFATDLPLPYVETLSDSERKSLPAAPDLSKFQDPTTWSPAKKGVMTAFASVVTMLAAQCAGVYSPGAEQMAKEWNVSHIAILVGIPSFTTGFSIAPMVLAPFSEINGRKPVVVGTAILFVICQICCGVSRSYGGFIAARAFQGVGASTFSTMIGGIIGDIFVTRERNTPMAIFSFGSIFGTGLGPLISSFIAQHLYWRWMFYVQVILDVVIIVPFLIVFDEPRGSVLLSRKARALNTWYAQLEDAGCPGMFFPSQSSSSSLDEFQSKPLRLRWKVAADEERANVATMLWISLTRPFHLLFTEPILFSFSMWVMFSWMVLYLTLGAVPVVYQELSYNFSIQDSGAVFASLCIGAVIFTPLCIYQEKFAFRTNWMRYRERLNSPEHRLVFSSFQSLLLPIGLFMFGWTARASIHPAVSALALMLATIGIFSIYLAVFNYLSDTYGKYASSALAAQSFCRNMAGGAIPLYTGAMFRGLGVGPASSLLGGVGLLLSMVPAVLLIWGPTIRGRSPFAAGSKVHA